MGNTKFKGTVKSAEKDTTSTEETLYLTLVAGKHWENIWMDEIELGLNFVAAKIVYRVTILIEDQVLSTGSKSKGIRKSK